jgi:uncharacterized repeat protein (TIGR03847 family)
MRRYDSVDSWVAGATGRPGERTFMIQFVAPDGVHTFILEKSQVAALVVEGRRLLAMIGTAEAAGPRGVRLDAAAIPEFRIAEIHLTYREDQNTVRVRLVPTSEDIADVEFALGPDEFASALGPAQEAVEGGRPSCPRCGLAIDPDGHHCPATNGDLRGHRP